MHVVVTRASRAIGIEAGEGRVFLWAFSTFFLVHGASVALSNASDTFFLKRIGVNLLPAAFLASALLLVLTTSLVARLAQHRAHLPLLARACFVLAAGLVPLWFLAVADVRSVFVLLVVIAKQVESAVDLLFWVALGGLLDARQAKRLYAPIVAGGTLGEILGSFASAFFAGVLGIAALLPIAAASLTLAGVLALRGSSLRPKRLTAPRPRRVTGEASALTLLAPLWRGSELFRILAVSALLCGALGPMLYFQFSYVADLATQGTSGELRLLSLYAAFRGWLNLAVLVLQLVGTARLFRRIGVPFAAALSPFVYLLGFFSVSLRLELTAAGGALAGTTLQDHAVYDPASQVLVTLFPERQRPAATTLIEGPVQRLGAVLGNLIVLAIVGVASPAWVGFAGLPIAGLWAAAALLLWRIYPTLLIEVAGSRRLQIEDQRALAELVDPATQRIVARALIDADLQRARAACLVVAEGPVEPAINALAHAAARAPAENRPFILTTLHRLLERNGDVHTSNPQPARELKTLLDDPERISIIERASVVEAYARLVPDLGPGSDAAKFLSRFLSDPAEPVRLVATTHLQSAFDLPSDGLDAMLTAALASGDPSTRHLALDEVRAALIDSRPPGVHAVPSARWTALIALLAGRLGEPRDRARAAEVLADLAARLGPMMASEGERLLPYMRDADPRVRSAVLRFIGNAQLDAHIGWVVERLSSSDESEATTAVLALRALGPIATKALLETLHRGKRTAREAVLPIVRDLHVDAATLRALIDRDLDRIRRTRILLHALASGRVPNLAMRHLRERVDEDAYGVLLLLATLYEEDRLADVARLLARSPHGRARAVLLEALDTLLPRDERARLMPLLDDVDARAAESAATALGTALPSFDEALREAMDDPDALLASFLGAPSHRAPLADGANVGDTAERHLGAEESESGMLKPVEIVLHLRSLELFSRLTTRQLSDIATMMHEEVHPAGTTILREGEFGDCMYVIHSGEVLISRAGQYNLTIKAGEMFGELSLFDGEARFATVSAVSQVRLLRLGRSELFHLMEEEPAIAIGMCQTLSHLTREAIKRLEAERAKQKSQAHSE